MRNILKLTAFIGLLLIGLYFYFVQIGRMAPAVEEHFIVTDRIPTAFDGVRIVQISDILIRDEACLQLLENVVERVNRLQPELVFFTGNLFLAQGLRFEAEAANLLSEIDAELAKIAISGHFDHLTDVHYEQTKATLAEAGFRYLANNSGQIFNQYPIGVNIIGIAPGLDSDTLEKALDIHSRDDRFNLLLMNDPTFTSIGIDHDINLQLSGHCLGTASGGDPNDPCFQFYSGLYTFSNEWQVYVTPGLARFYRGTDILRPPTITSFILLRP